MKQRNSEDALTQRLWVKEQEVAALKTQNRHLIARLEELEQKKTDVEENTAALGEFRGNLTTQLSAALNSIQEQIHRFTNQILSSTETSLKSGFDTIQQTMRALYTQNQRSQQQIEKAVGSIGTLEQRVDTQASEVLNQSKVHNLQFQDKVIGNLNGFMDRVERLMDSRLQGLSEIARLDYKQEELLTEIKNLTAASPRAEIKLLRGELKAVLAELDALKSQMELSNPAEAIEVLIQAQEKKAKAVETKSEMETYLKRIQNNLPAPEREIDLNIDQQKID
jgi:hypothetical protein